MRKDPESYQRLQQLLDKLKTGNLTSFERDELYQLAINDPFLKDAIEGYNLFPEIDHQANIDKLKSKVISHQSEKKHPITQFWLKAAAVALIIAFGGWLLWGNLSQQDKTKFAAQAENEIQVEPPLLMPNDEEDSYAIVESKELLQSEKINDISESRADISDKKIDQKTETSVDKLSSFDKDLNAEDQAFVIDAVPSGMEEMTIEEVSYPDSSEQIDSKRSNDQPKNDLARSEPLVSAEVESLANASEVDSQLVTPSTDDIKPLKSYSNAMSQIDLSKTIIGTVLDADGNPLIGANVIEKGTQNGALTDLDGRFSITLLGTSNPVIVNFMGFDEYEIAPALAGQNIEIKLSESQTSMDEVFVSTYSEKSRRQLKDEENIILAEPTVGLKKYRRYIKENAQYPSGHSNKTINGVVTVRFRLNADGTPLSVEIVSSFNRIFNAEAIRLIKQGGTWQTKRKSQSGWIEYDVQF
jgi:TonB family protein